MASKLGTDTVSTKDIEEMLDAVDQTLDRLKTLYEQYFLGIQKQAPAFIHSDVERKLRDLTQLNVRNTGLRYRLATLQQKFGSYNSYWRRTLRQIENGTYIRNLAKIGRDAAKNGTEIPEEILAAMPKRMREQVIRDRDAALAIAKRRKQVEEEGALGELPPEVDDVAAMINEPSIIKRELKPKGGAHVLSADDADMDFDAFFSAFDDDAPKAEKKPAAPAPAATQAITMPIPRTRQDTEPDIALDGSPAPPTQAMPVVPPTRPSQPTAMPTSAIPRPGAPPVLTAPRAGQPAGVVPPRPNIPTPARPTSAIPSPPSTQASASETSAIPRPIGPQATEGMPTPQRPTPSIPLAGRQTGPVPVVGRQTGPIPTIQNPPPRPPPDASQRTQAIPTIPKMTPASQASRPNPIAPGAAAKSGPTPVESMAGPFPRQPPAAPPQPPPPPQRPTPPATPRPTPSAPQKPPPGMTDADVNALHAKYVAAKQMVGEKVDASSREKLLRTINQTAPKIMEQYKASGVDFSVVVKDNQVVIKAKPKT